MADSYLERRPAERKRWEEYAQARREAGSASPLDWFLVGGNHGPMRPAELGGGVVQAAQGA